MALPLRSLTSPQSVPGFPSLFLAAVHFSRLGCLLLGASSPIIGGGDKALRSSVCGGAPIGYARPSPQKKTPTGAPSPNGVFFGSPPCIATAGGKSPGPFPVVFRLLWRAPSLPPRSARAPCAPPDHHKGALKRNLFSRSVRWIAAAVSGSVSLAPLSALASWCGSKEPKPSPMAFFQRCQPRLAVFFLSACLLAITGGSPALRLVAAALSALWSARWRRLARGHCYCSVGCPRASPLPFFQGVSPAPRSRWGSLYLKICPHRLRAVPSGWSAVFFFTHS